MTSLRPVVVRAAISSRSHGGGLKFLPFPLRAAGAALMVAVLLGCASPSKRVLTLQNSYDYREARYEENCVATVGPEECTAAVAALRTFEKHLHEAAKALQNGGGLPLQLAAIKADEKAAARFKVTR